MITMTTIKQLQQLLEDMTYEEVYLLQYNFKEALATDKDFAYDKEVNKKMNTFVETYDVKELYEVIEKEVENREKEQAFNNIVGACYEFMEFELFADFNLARAFYEFYHLATEQVKRLYETVDYENVNYPDALETFKESKEPKDLMIFMKAFAKVRNIDVQKGFTQAEKFKDRKYVINTLIQYAGLKVDRIEVPRYDHTFNKFLIEDITRDEQKAIYKLYEERKIKSIDNFEILGMTLITV